MRATAYIDEDDCTIEATGSEAAYLVKLECIANGIPLNRLRALVEADRDGRCVVLPCKVGTDVYSVDNGKIYKRTVDTVTIDKDGFKSLTTFGYTPTKYTADKMGMKLFLTREAAEDAINTKV